MSKMIEISDELEKKIVAFCEDELNYHIHDSCYADEYESEITAQIELLRLLGYKDMADEYEDDFKGYMESLKEEKDSEDLEDEECEEDEISGEHISPGVLEDSKISMKDEFSGYGNGHCTYMICGIADEKAFEDYIARVNLK